MKNISLSRKALAVFLLVGLTFGAMAKCANNPVQVAIAALTGQWIGQGIFTDGCAAPKCSWRGSYGLDLTQTGNNVTGEMDFTVLLESVLIPGSSCIDHLIEADAQITGTVDGNVFTFADPKGNTWSMAFTDEFMQGSVAANPNGTCDGTDLSSQDVFMARNESGNPTGGESAQTRRIVDRCDDNKKINYRLYDLDDNANILQVWPSDGSFYTADVLNATYLTTITCLQDHKICIGAATDDGATQHGVGLDLTQSCIECCQFCQSAEIFDDQFDCVPQF